jgi:hypothetical protein
VMNLTILDSNIVAKIKYKFSKINIWESLFGSLPNKLSE